MSRLVLADIDVIMDIYYNKPVLTTADIMRLFNCGRTVANKKRKEAQAAEKTLYSESTANTAQAFQLWGIDIKDIERRYLKKMKLKERGLIG